MTDSKRLPTINIGKGVDYAKVVTRLIELLGDNPECSIETSYDLVADVGVFFRAVVSTKRGTFTGHSYGKIGGRQKQFEKQETIAVGRALAFAGYLASGEIASMEEMAESGVEHSQVPPSDVPSVGIGKAQLEQLKLDWFGPRREDLIKLNKTERAGLFSEWVLRASGKPEPDHHRKWDSDQYNNCLAKLVEEQE